MDLIIELIKAIIEAVDNSKAKRKALADGIPVASPENNAPANFAIQQRVLEKQEEIKRLREVAAARAAAEALTQQNSAAANARVEPARQRPPTGAQRMARLLRQPVTARELMLLSEILGPPKALRRGRH